ncbi:hypothetical protein [Tropicimonas sp. IMCC34011]|uniref:hypothetical protein n=1 Tax=Tropicimonas sp. IMCC34011 TaxID=2248759 RepID=UPI000E282A0F|nr:hypothetical protein [Tropicimonas sp. IMCC34011]
MTALRDKLVKLRFSQEEFSLLETLRRTSGSESRAVFIRRRALEPEIGTQAIADLVGQVGVTLNTYDIAPKQLDHLALLLGELTLELRSAKKS